MKYFSFLIIFLNTILFNCYGQIQEHYKVLNLKDSLPIEGVYISANDILTSISDADGHFELNKKIETLQLSHVTFKPIILSKEKITESTIYLEENNEELDEIILSTNKERRVLLPSNNYKNLFGQSKGAMANHNTVYATFIPNQTDKPGLIKKIIIEVSEGIDGDPNKIFMPFRVNLFSVDPLTKLPDQVLLQEAILTCKKKGAEDKFVYVDISDFFVDFPEEGIFVSVKTLNLQELEKYGNISSQSPAFRKLRLKQKNESKTYSRIYSWNRLTRDEDIILKDWIDETVPNPDFIYNFGIEVQFE